MINQKYYTEMRIIKDFWGTHYHLQRAVPIDAGKGWDTIFTGTEDECKSAFEGFDKLGCTLKIEY